MPIKKPIPAYLVGRALIKDDLTNDSRLPFPYGCSRDPGLNLSEPSRRARLDKYDLSFP